MVKLSLKPHFFPKTAKKLTCYAKNKWEKKMKLVKTVKNFHRKNETGKTCKKVLKTIKIPKSPLKSVTVPQ